MGGRSSQVIRKVQTSPVADFDDQLWPVNCAILILAGFVAGIVVATSDFDEANIFCNAWFGLGTVAVAVILLFAATAWLKDKMVRRVQFCVLLSLLLHLWGGMFLHDRYLALVAQREQAAKRTVEKKEPITVPDYYWHHIEQSPQRQSFEKPVQTPAPRPTEPQPPKRQEIKHEPPPRKESPADPKPSPPQQPNPAELQRAVVSAPRRAEQAAGAQISRQQSKREPRPERPIPQPRIEPQPRQTPTASSANTQPRRQQPIDIAIGRWQAAEATPRPFVERETMKLARRATQTDSLRPTPNRPQRQRIPAPQVTDTRASAAQPTAAASGPPEPKPNVPLTRQHPKGLVAKRQAAEPMPSTPRAVSSAVALSGPRRTEQRDGQLVHLPAPNRVARGSVMEVAPPRVAMPVEARAATSRPPTPLSAAPGGTSVVRTAAGSAQVARHNVPAASVPAAALAAGLTTSVGRRASGSQRAQSADLAYGPGAVARAPAAVSLPSTAAGTSATGPATLAAVGAAGHIEAPSAARVVGRSAAAAPSGSNTTAVAVAGPTVGPSRIRLPSGGHATAGGRRQLAATGTAIPRMSRTRRPALWPADAGTAVAEPAGSSAEASATTASGGPPSTMSGSSATAAVRAGSGVAGRPAIGAGPDGSVGSAIPLAVALPARAAARGPSPSLSPGGGVPSPARTAAGSSTAETLASLPGPGGSAAESEHAASASREAGTPQEQQSAGTAGGEASGARIADQPAMLAGHGQGQRLQPAGLPGRPMGTASSGQTASGASAPGALGTSIGSRRAGRGDRRGPSLAAEVGGLPLRRSGGLAAVGGPAEAIQLPPGLAAGLASSGALAELATGSGAAGPARQRGGLPVEIAAVEGPGGLNPLPSPEVGLPSRRARRDSDVVHTIARRFIQRSGGLMAIDGHVPQPPAEAFRQREPGRRADVARGYGGTNENEEAVELGLDFLARHQFPDGHWSLNELPSDGEGYEDAAVGQMQSDTAATGLALLAFLGAGYTHSSDKYQEVVRRGLGWTIANQKADGELFSGGTDYARFYSNGIGAIALCEAYGMTRDPELQEPCRRVIRFILDSQHPTSGGWRYQPRTESDTSVSGWLLMALKSAQMAGLEVPRQSLRGVSGWLDTAQAEDGSRYVYNPLAEDNEQQRAGRRPNLSMTAEGLLMRMYLGWQRQNPALAAGAEHLKSNLPELGDQSRPLRDVYYWYYATQVMFQMQGDYWDSWHGRLQPLLAASQQQSGPLAGSWHPLRPVPDRWGHAGGRHYVTTMNLLMLEVYYRHLPLFQTLAK